MTPTIICNGYRVISGGFFRTAKPPEARTHG